MKWSMTAPAIRMQGTIVDTTRARRQFLMNATTNLEQNVATNETEIGTLSEIPC